MIGRNGLVAILVQKIQTMRVEVPKRAEASRRRSAGTPR
jgi:hypothetical protein